MVTVTVGNGQLMKTMKKKRTVEFDLKLAFQAHEVSCEAIRESIISA